jgi:hypothetical protein
VNLTAGLDDVEKRKFLTLPRLKLRLLCRPDRSQSVYRLYYPGYVNYLIGIISPFSSKENSEFQ